MRRSVSCSNLPVSHPAPASPASPAPTPAPGPAGPGGKRGACGRDAGCQTDAPAALGVLTFSAALSGFLGEQVRAHGAGVFETGFKTCKNLTTKPENPMSTGEFQS
jgi:hypothetical protein